MVRGIVGALALYLFLMNLLTFAAFGWDKRCAQRDRRRTPERRLLLVAALGGAVGALVGMRVFHHKTRKLRFRLLVPLFLLLHLGLAAMFYVTYIM